MQLYIYYIFRYTYSSCRAYDVSKIFLKSHFLFAHELSFVFVNHTHVLINATQVFFAAIWRTVVDGFANVLHESSLRSKLKPNMITGDFDSISKEAMQFYKQEVRLLGLLYCLI